MNYPKWANYECQDKWGRHWVWSHEPNLENYQGHEIWGVQDVPNSKCMMLKPGAIPLDWRQTLVKIH